MLHSSWATSASTSLHFPSFSNFLIIVFNIFFLIFTLLQPFSLLYLFISPLLLQPFSLPYLFISPLSFKLILLFLFPFIFLYFCLFIFTPFYYKFVTISSILYIIFPKKKKSLFLSLSLSLSQIFGGFLFLFFLHICFRLIIFYIL